jgi:hypothetical protein
MILASRVFTCARSWSTRAVIPTLVAVRTDAEERVDVRGLVGEKPRSDAPAERERRDHAEHRHEERRRPDLRHLADRGLQPYFEEQDDHAEARENAEHAGSVRIPSNAEDADEREVAEQDPREELAEDRGLLQADRRPAAELVRARGRWRGGGARGRRDRSRSTPRAEPGSTIPSATAPERSQKIGNRPLLMDARAYRREGRSDSIEPRFFAREVPAFTPRRNHGRVIMSIATRRAALAVLAGAVLLNLSFASRSWSAGSAPEPPKKVEEPAFPATQGKAPSGEEKTSAARSHGGEALRVGDTGRSRRGRKELDAGRKRTRRRGSRRR